MTCLRRQRSAAAKAAQPEAHVVTMRVPFTDGDVGLYEIFKGTEAEALRIWEGVSTVYFEQGRRVDQDCSLDIALLSLHEWEAFLRSVGA